MSDDTVLKLSQPSTFSDPLTEVLRSGARSLLARAVEAEVAGFLDGHSEARTEEGRRRLVRHGHLPEREIMTGIGPVAVRAPRVRDRTGLGADRIRFSSALLPPYARRSKSLEVLPVLYLTIVERDPARHPQPRCDLTLALAAAIAVFIGYREDAPFPAGADEECAFLAPGHLPCIGDFREGLDDEALREMDGGEAIVPLCSGGAEESGAEQQGQDDGSHDPTHMREARRLSQCTEASRRCSGAIPAQERSMQALAGGLVVPSTVFRSIRADDNLSGARRRSDPTGDPWTLYRRAASTMIRPRPRRSK